MNHWLEKIPGYLQWPYIWLLQLGVGVVFLCILYLIIRRLIKKKELSFLQPLLGVSLDGEKALLPSIKVLFWIIGLSYGVGRVSQGLACENCSQVIRPFRDASILLCIFWMVHRVQQEFCRVKGSRIKGVAFTFSKIFSVLLVVVTGMILLHIFSVNITPLLAFGGIGAAVLGFAAKDVVSSFVGGMMISITRPFSLYDSIFLPEHDLEGTVEEIGWCLTTIREKDQRLAYLPNTIFPQTLIINASRRIGRRILETFRLRHADIDKLDGISLKVKELLSKEACIDQNMPILIFVNAFGEYAIEMQLDVHTNATTWKAYAVAKDRVLRLVLSVVYSEGAEMAYPIALYEKPVK